MSLSLTQSQMCPLPARPIRRPVPKAVTLVVLALLIAVAFGVFEICPITSY